MLMPAKGFLRYWEGKNHSQELASCWNCKQFLFYNHTSMWLVIFSSRVCRGFFCLQNTFKACAYLWRNKIKWVCSSLLLFAIKQIASENTRIALQRHISVLCMDICKCACVRGYHMHWACLLPHTADFLTLPAFNALSYTNSGWQWGRSGEERCSVLRSVYSGGL